jgi:hypothetical protein
MTFNIRTVIGGFVTGVATLILTFIQITDEASIAVSLSFILPMIAAGLVAYSIVFSGVKNRLHRLSAATGAAFIFMFLLWAVNELLVGRFVQLSPMFRIVVGLCLIAATFAVAVAAVVWIASIRKLRLAN